MEHQGATPAPHLPEQPVAPAAPPAPERSSTGWRWFIGAVVVLLLAAFACSFVAFWAYDSGPTIRTSGGSVALLYLDGVIAGTGSVYNGIITPEYFVDQLQQADDDPSVRAILIRVDSPGGTVAASQEISMEIARIEKPIVVSVGDICASGAYMISSQCDEIVATPTSSVGSIGVIAQIPNVEGLLDTLGIEFTVLTAGEYKDAGSPYRSMTATETALFEEYIDVAYREFIDIVAEGRSLPADEVEEMATGWMWPGMVAREMGLVDSLGTFNDALDRAAELGGIEGEPNVVTYIADDYSGLLRSLIGFGSRLERLGIFAPDADAVRRTLPH
ncbi:MAG: signal peptide peptidase SppA [Anaerosomatales bacterium]